MTKNDNEKILADSGKGAELAASARTRFILFLSTFLSHRKRVRKELETEQGLKHAVLKQPQLSLQNIVD